ncbi:ATP-binding protein [Micrococcus sp. HMSC067E09]|uniref:ATP-binding protein n=1 Tax=Micrococcus sp. HMSC067E09 TaxID=1739367 RepID=UPI000AE260BF|nr:SbcC/MukB-like Walker B domain-containing protein [Micrococcus sp. HMSC067E09]
MSTLQMTDQKAFELGPQLDVRPVEPAPQRQWRLASVQIANWGTMDGRIYRFPVSRRGHLITGPSGSGKSSVLDAIASVLTPDKWLKFNQAAQAGGERAATRSVVSYVRGAWTRQQDEQEDRVVSAYLRPRATWSGVVLTYRDGTGGVVSLARLFFLRGTSMSSADMRDLCLLERSEVELAELQTLIDDGIKTRRVQDRWPKAVVTTNGTHGKFYARLRSVFGMRDDAALRLLHRTQSAKGLDSLDQLFRHHMLEVPQTFEMADKAVEEFGALRTAYEHVTDLRQQRDHLLQVRTVADEYETALSDTERLRRLQEAIHPYRQSRELENLRREVQQVRGSLRGLRARQEEARAALERAEQRRAGTMLALHQAGGGQIEELGRQISAEEEQRQDRERRHAVLLSRLSEAGLEAVPGSVAEFGELHAMIETDLARNPEHAGPTHEQFDERSRLKEAVAELDEDINALRRVRSSVPRRLLDVRKALAEHLSVPYESLPFAAELLEVSEEHREWTGAIERVLAPLSLTLLVPTRLLARAQEWIDGRHLGVRLRFDEVSARSVSVPPARSQDSLVHKVTVKRGEFHDWLQARLVDRFDLACVTSAAELARHERAVTLAGQVKHGRGRFEKDDRFRVDDRSRWVLGDPAAKLEVLVAARQARTEELSRAEEAVDRALHLADSERQRRAALKAVLETEWKDVDREGPTRRIAELQARIKELSSVDSDLEQARLRNDEAEEAWREARETAREADVAVDFAEKTERELTGQVKELTAVCAQHEPLDDALRADLDARFRAVRRSSSPNALADAAESVRHEVTAQAEQAQTAAARAAQRCTMLTTEFSRQWASAAADASPGVEDRGSYLAILERIIGQGLPDHEGRFQTLLHDRSSVLFGELHSAIRSAPGDITDRVERINTSLRRSPFDEGRFLRLRVRTRRTETVTQFLRDLSTAATHAWEDDTLEDAERRYAALASIMDRLASSDHVDRSWRRQCLDTREHVTFLAEEIDAAGEVHATYDSGAAMSGGQQQKLVVFCLAAALRYQLAAPEDPLPVYGTVVLDEAFDKADARYTRMAMDVFVEFGFQMVLATPQKLLQTIEPYVGGITTVENPTRRLTRLADITWEDDK